MRFAEMRDFVVDFLSLSLKRHKQIISCDDLVNVVDPVAVFDNFVGSYYGSKKSFADPAAAH